MLDYIKVKKIEIFFTNYFYLRPLEARSVISLLWSQDFAYDRDLSTFTDPDVSVTPLELQLEPSQVGRAIYF